MTEACLKSKRGSTQKCVWAATDTCWTGKWAVRRKKKQAAVVCSVWWNKEGPIANWMSFWLNCDDTVATIPKSHKFPSTPSSWSSLSCSLSSLPITPKLTSSVATAAKVGCLFLGLVVVFYLITTLLLPSIPHSLTHQQQVLVLGFFVSWVFFFFLVLFVITATSKQWSKTNKQACKQTNKQACKQTNKQASKQASNQAKQFNCCK